MKISTQVKDSSQSRIAAVVVTYNRAQLLSECVESLLHQTRQLDGIFIIDNCSSDDTEAVVKKIMSRNPKIHYFRLSSNTGGAGGFHQGVKTAFEKGFDWIWLMDDDVEAYPDALNGLLRYSEQSLCIHGQRTNPNGKIYHWQAKFSSKIGLAIPSPDKGHSGDKAFCKVNVGCFEGMLIHRAVIEKIGFPDPRFFITWDDTIYGFLASKWTDVFYVRHLSLKRKRTQNYIDLGVRTFVEVSDLYRFYHIRNRRLVKEYIKNEADYCDLCFDIMTIILFIKEVVRALILQKNLFAFRSLWKGLKSSYNLKNVN